MRTLMQPFTTPSHTLCMAQRVPQTSKADLHIHTTHSDGIASVQEVLAHVAHATDLKVIAITDHDCIAGSKQAARLAPSYGIEAIVGEEISTQHGHLLALFTERHIPAGKPAWETIADIHAQGGLAVAPHPFDASVPSLGASELAPFLNELDLDGIEGFNAGVYWHQRSCNALAQQRAQVWQLPLTGGSDSHSLPTLGKGFTTFAGNTAQDLFHAIKTHQVNCGGSYWSLANYWDNWRHAVQDHGILATARWAWHNAGQPSRSTPSV